jgi:hypothetical protein
VNCSRTAGTFDRIYLLVTGGIVLNQQLSSKELVLLLMLLYHASSGPGYSTSAFIRKTSNTVADCLVSFESNWLIKGH